MQLPEDLLALARAGAGVNNIPLDACAEAGIVAFNTPGANANAVKELVLCGMLLASRGIIDGAAWCRDHADSPTIGKDAEKAKKAFAGHEVFGKTLGVIGLGAIGALVANAAIDLGMNVLGYDPYVSAEAAWRLSPAVEHVTNLDDVLHRSDYVTIHVPAMDSTRGMIGAHELEVAKPGCAVLNFSRDTLVDNAAMTEALAAGRVATYVTDFATPEVMTMTNTLVLPHLGASTAEAEDNCAIMAAHQIKDYLENGNIKNSVNYPACDMGPAPAEGGRVAVLHANVPDMLSQITGVFGEVGANIDMIVQNLPISDPTKANITFTLPEGDAQKALDALEAHRDEIGFNELRYNPNIGKLSLVGVGMRTNPGVSARLFSALSDAGINIDLISTSEIRISVVTRLDDLDRAVKAVHTAFGLDASETEAVVYGGTGR